MSTRPNWPLGPRIYNLFPLLAGPLPQWSVHLERARQMEFNWVFINAFHYAGYSGSLYAIKDYYTIDPRLLDSTAGSPEAQLREVLQTAHKLGLSVMMDLVINHTAFDSPLVKEHPQWYKRGPDGKPLHPTAKDGDAQVTWGDLREIDNANSPDRANLWQYWRAVAEHYASLGFNGFRCDAAYKVPGDLWQFLFRHIKQAYPDTQFFAESLGCPFSEILRLAKSGFDGIFNSSKWWDFSEPWCLDQHRQTAPLVPSISFAESHDTERLATELNGDREAVKQRYAFSALFATGVMMPVGFEYGFRRRLDVVKTKPEDWETPTWDLSTFITSVNRLKQSYQVFNEEGPIETLESGNARVLALTRSSLDRKEKVLLLLNKDRRQGQSCQLARLGYVFTGMAHVQDVSPEEKLQHTADFQIGQLKPSGLHVIYARAL
ncbi:MAG: alpha-amylase family glycosyl hydrolase [Candidatus Binatia bacterium]